MSVDFNVIIIGAGPAGLGVATSLVKQGIDRILILDRESQAGGVPRHCQHPTFGLQTFKRPMKGHVWVTKLIKKLDGKCEIRTATTVLKLESSGRVQVSSSRGIETLSAKRIVMATGVRETPRHPRLVSGMRPQGILTTGALQQFIYLKKLTPCQKPVIIGTELVSFSALWALRHAGIKPRAIIEENDKISVWDPAKWFAKLLGVPVMTNTKLESIQGKERVESISLNTKGNSQSLDCDGVIFSGKFVGDTSLIRSSHLAHQTMSGIPEHDQFGRCSDPTFFVAGNMLHPADMGDQCYLEGIAKGRFIADELISHTQALSAGESITVQHSENISLVSPTFLTKTNLQTTINIRFKQHFKGEVFVKANNQVIHRQLVSTIPERRVLLKNVNIPNNAEVIEIVSQ